MFRLHVDRGQDAVGAHAAEQPEPADPGTGADLHDGPRTAGRGQQPERRTGTRRDGVEPDLPGQATGGTQDQVLGDVRFGELECLGGRRTD
ncbi:hypothetical protein Pma05_30290 [Plantactinospora mayteni]|uniref:Uncharacterized protein n=1 Tax=Plantactinospora mayteni TaxID=566021 RepID=A0ABQ4EP81_9ACTN|nr:hypothetical protein Pma05_30290 [Plantactinospora mayteni]